MFMSKKLKLCSCTIGYSSKGHGQNSSMGWSHHPPLLALCQHLQGQWNNYWWWCLGKNEGIISVQGRQNTWKGIAVCSLGFHLFSVITLYCLSFALYRVLGLDYSTMFVMYMIGAGVLAATGNWRTMSFLGLIGEIKTSKPSRKLFLIPSYSPVSSFMFVSGKNDCNWNTCSLINGEVEFKIMCMWSVLFDVLVRCCMFLSCKPVLFHLLGTLEALNVQTIFLWCMPPKVVLTGLSHDFSFLFTFKFAFLSYTVFFITLECCCTYIHILL